MDNTQRNTSGEMPTLTPHPWDQLHDEGERDYATFRAYLLMPPPRSARGLAQQTGLPSRKLDRVRAQYRWMERAAAYDDFRIQKALESAPVEVGNPYERMLQQAAMRAQNLHDAANLLLVQATRRMDWAERQYLKDIGKVGVMAADVEPPMPSTHIVSCIRGASDVMAKCAEAQAMLLGVSDVLKMQAASA